MSYEYRNKRNYLFGIGMGYGQMNLSYTANYDFHYFDPNYLIVPDTKPTYSFSEKVPYISASISIGHEYSPFKNKRIKIQGKTGLSYMKELIQYNENSFGSITYQVKDTLFKVDFINPSVNNPTAAFYYTLYCGLSYDLDMPIPIKRIQLGLNFIHAFGFRRDNDYVGFADIIYYDSKSRLMSGDRYTNRFRNLGLTLGITF